jgi:hypothetical protein
MSQGPAHDLAILIRSGWRLISFETFEEDRALRVIERVAEGLERKPVVWTSASGFSGTGQGAGELENGIDAIRNIAEPAIFVLLDAHVALRHAVTTRKLRDLLPQLGRRRQVVVMLGPVVEMPVELVREAGHVGMPLPRADELEALFRRVLDQGDEPADADQVTTCVRAALGLTAAEAVRVLRKASALSEGLNAATAAHIVREKSLALRRTPALAFHDTAEGLEQVGGLDALKAWLRERRRAFGDQAKAFGLPLPRGLLLLGVQGCGKSLSAKSVAVEWGFPLLRLDLASVFAGGAQSPEAAIKEAILVAESISPAVLWIDEIEKGFAATDRDPHASRVFGSFLTWLGCRRNCFAGVASTSCSSSTSPPSPSGPRFSPSICRSAIAIPSSSSSISWQRKPSGCRAANSNRSSAPGSMRRSQRTGN